MANYVCRCKIYANCKILPWKNFRVDNITEYLSSSEVGPDNQSNYFILSQYFKHKLETTIKINILEKEEQEASNVMWHQEAMEFRSWNNYNYISIQNGLTAGTGIWQKICYYFIIDKKWLSDSCVEFKLKMDVINTFLGNVEDQTNSDVLLSEKTMILREHKNRWIKQTGQTEYYYPVIDFYSENINPVLFKTNEYGLNEKVGNYEDGGSYYLIYRSRGTGTAEEDKIIDVFLCADTNLEINISGVGYTGELNLESVLGNPYQYSGVILGNDDYNGYDNTNVEITWTMKKNKNETETFTRSITGGNQVIIFTARYVEGGHFDSHQHYVQDWIYSYRGGTNNKIEVIQVKNLQRLRKMAYNPTGATFIPINIKIATAVSGIPPTAQSLVVSDISQVNRTDEKLLKIIKLPYKPVGFEMNSNGELTSFPSGWAFSSGITGFPDMLKYIDLDLTQCLKHNIEFSSYTGFITNPLNKLNAEHFNDFGMIHPRTDLAEPKIYNSEFYKPTFVYDSFVMPFNLECVKTGETSGYVFTTNLKCQFSVSLTMSSKFMFLFSEYKNSLRKDTQNYSALCYVVRNNELPIFNSAYLNYIRTGYNYDLKTRNRQLASNIVGGVLSTIGAVASFVAGPYTMGTSVVAGVGLAVNALSKTYNAITQTAQADQNIAQKLHNAELQGVSVAGADDVDLMTEYTEGNKAKIVYYEVSPKMKECLLDLFYYFGYIAGYQGIPNITSRSIFNFVQAEVLFEKVPNLPNEIVEEISGKYKEGITFLHEFTNSKIVSGETIYFNDWDFEQQYENWEANL